MIGDDDRGRLQREIAKLDDLWDFDNPAASETTFRDLLRRAQAAGASRDEIDIVRTQLARTMSLRQRFDEAHALLDKVLGSDPSDPLVSQRAPLVAVRYLLERGRTFNSAGQRPEALGLFRHAWDRACAANLDALAVDAAHMLAIASSARDDRVEWNLRAMDRAQSSSDSRARAWQASLENNLGWIHHEAGNFERALAHFEAALRFRCEQRDSRRIAIARWCIARCFRSLGKVEEALAIQLDLRNAPGGGATGDGFIEEELGECLLGLGRIEEARPHFLEAWRLLSRDSHFVAAEPDRVRRLATLGDAPAPS